MLPLGNDKILRVDTTKRENKAESLEMFESESAEQTRQTAIKWKEKTIDLLGVKFLSVFLPFGRNGGILACDIGTVAQGEVKEAFKKIHDRYRIPHGPGQSDFEKLPSIAGQYHERLESLTVHTIFAFRKKGIADTMASCGRWEGIDRVPKRNAA